jgi:hypothetical protein
MKRIVSGVVCAGLLVTGSAAVAATAPVPGARLPIVHSGAHPGAAQLAGDVPHPVSATPIPSLRGRKFDFERLHCQVQHATRTPQYCVISDVAKPKFTVALIGDSMAGQWIYAMRRIVAAHHWRLIFATHASCPFSAIMPIVPSTGRQYVSCHDWSQSVVNRLTTHYHPNVVIVGDRPVEASLHHPHRGPAANRELGKGMAEYWKQLIAAHSVVVGIRETPERNGNSVTPRRVAIKPVTPIVVAGSLVTKFAHVIDLNNDICTSTTCNTIVGNIRVYRDSHHMTRTYVRTLAPYLERKLMKLNVFKGH